MAKYHLNYSCGHGQFTVDIGGPTKDRERKADWYQNTRVCSECYIKSKKEEDAKTPLGAEVIVNVYGPNSGPHIVINKGDTYSIKDKLKALGCYFAPYFAQGDFLGMKEKKAWMIKINPDDVSATADVVNKLIEIGVKKINIDNGPWAEIMRNIASKNKII